MVKAFVTAKICSDIMLPFESPKNILLNVLQAVNRRVNRFKCSPMLPEALTFATTYRCNSKCIPCNIWKIYKNNNRLAREELTLSEIQDFFSEKDFLKYLSWIQLTGGEPFLRNDLVDIVKCIHKCQTNCLIYIATNGFLTDRITEVTKEIVTFHRNISLGISFDGINTTHDKMRGINNAFEKACKTLRLLTTNFPDIPIQITMTATPMNFRDIPRVYDFAKKNRCFFRVALANRAVFYQNIEKKFSFSKEDIQQLKEYFNAIKKDLIRNRGKIDALSELFWLDGNLKLAIDPEKRILPCYSGFTQFFLDPYGIVYPCLVFSEQMGNIREKKIRDIWFSERSKTIRKRIRQNKCPNCWIAHEAVASISNDYFRKFKFFFKR